MLKTYEYRLYPTKEQEVLLAKHFGCVRLVYNKALALKKKLWEEKKETISCFDLCHELTKWKQTEELAFLYEVSNPALQQAIRHLDTAYKNFFNKGGYPKFKSKRGRQSYSVINSCYVVFDKEVIRIPKFQEGIKARIDRTFEGKIKTCTVKKTTTGKYFISVLVEDNKQLPELLPITKETTVGIDLGISKLAVLSNGEIVENTNYLKNSEKRLKVLQRRASRKCKGSNRQKKAYKKVALLYERVRNCRKDYLHKFTSKLVNDNQISTICLEDLNVSGMMKNHRLAKSISDSAFREIRRQLEYKCKWNGKNLLLISKFYPSSKTCNSCGYIKEDLTLQDRKWLCPICGVKHDRDFNASKNIRDEALRNCYSGQGMPVGLVEPSSIEETMKREQVISNTFNSLEESRV